MAGTSLNPLWPHYAAVAALALALFAGAFRFLILDSQDPLKCSALLNQGQWMDSKFKNWQPEGCMLYNYKSKDVSTCMAARRILFAGDSVTRQLFFAFAHLTDSALPSAPPSDDQKHSDHSLHAGASGVDVDFLWDPFLNSSRLAGMLDDRPLPPDSKKPSLLVLGSGLWYLRYSTESGGLPAWESKIDSVFGSIKKQMPTLADKVVFLPVERPVADKLSAERAATIHEADVDAMNSDLLHRVEGGGASSLFGPAPYKTDPIAVPSVFNQMLQVEQTKDGLHYSDAAVAQHANLLLNFRCNEYLPKRYPFDKTCCNSYPQTPWLQFLLFIIVVFIGPFCKFAGPYLTDYKPTLVNFLPSNDYYIPLTIFGAVVGLNFMADRTTVWLKEQKQFEPWVFAGLCLISLAVGLGTSKAKDKDLGFLNREQTDEWKGWMQIAILIYHYLGASKISGIYNPIRVLVAAYLWMSGYGHFHFYYKKADYGMLRIAQVMVRLNTLTIVLAYVMDTDYVFYYFAPLVSFWFAIIYGTMWVGHKYNENTPFIIAKMLASSAVVTYVFKSEWMINLLFDVLNRFFSIRWEAREWIFRVTLDLWIVYVGMFVALLTIKIQQHSFTESTHWPFARRSAIITSVMALIWFFWFEVSQPTKYTYNKYHPYISWAPVLAFIVLRNSTTFLRSTSSKAFAFVGRCSLETFIMQYHFWLAADTRGILMILPLGTSWRTLNMIFSSIGFIYVSHHVAEATGWITNWVCGTPRKRSLPTTASAPRQSTQATRRGEESIPLMAQTGETKTENPSGEAKEESTTVFDAETAESNSTQPQRPAPDSQPRWLQRLADERPGEPGPAWSPYVATRNRVFGAWSGASDNIGASLGVKGAGILIVLWILNILWPS